MKTPSVGRAIGIVMTGLLLGVLLARTFSGWLARLAGWRLVFAVAAAINLCFVPLLWRRMPKLLPKAELSYAQAIRSLWTLWRTQPALRETCMVGGLMFASFKLLLDDAGLSARVEVRAGSGALPARSAWWVRRVR